MALGAHVLDAFPFAMNKQDASVTGGKALTCGYKTGSLATVPHLRLQDATYECRDRSITCYFRALPCPWGLGCEGVVGGQHKRIRCQGFTSYLPGRWGVGDRCEIAFLTLALPA